jgi:hypothetical protein
MWHGLCRTLDLIYRRRLLVKITSWAGVFFAKTPSRSGYQVSLFGLLGLMAAKEEGIELNILGLTFGIEVMNPALKLPLAGRIGSANMSGS